MTNRDIIHMLIRLSIVHKYRVSQAANASGIYYGQPPILDYISENPGCTQSELCENTHVSAPSIAVSVQRLMKAGLIEKERDGSDKRCNRLRLTQKGEQLRLNFRGLCDDIDNKFFTGFSQAEKETFTDFISRITCNLEAQNVSREEIERFFDKTHQRGEEGR